MQTNLKVIVYTLEQLVIEKQKEKDLMVKNIHDLEYKLAQLKDDHFDLYDEIESLEHVIELFKNNK